MGDTTKLENILKKKLIKFLLIYLMLKFFIKEKLYVKTKVKIGAWFYVTIAKKQFVYVITTNISRNFYKGSYQL